MGGFGFAAFTEIQVYRTQEWWRIFEKSSLALFFRAGSVPLDMGYLLLCPTVSQGMSESCPFKAEASVCSTSLLLCVLSVFGYGFSRSSVDAFQ